MEIRDDINTHYEGYPVKVDVHDQYYNMAEKIKPLHHIIDIPKRVFAKLDITLTQNLYVVEQTAHNYHLWDYLLQISLQVVVTSMVRLNMLLLM